LFYDTASHDYRSHENKYSASTDPSSPITGSRFLSHGTALLSRRLLNVLRILLGKVLFICLKDIKGKNFGKEQAEDEFKQRLGRQVIILSAVCLVYEDQVLSICFIHHCQTNYEHPVPYLSVVRDEVSSAADKS